MPATERWWDAAPVVEDGGGDDSWWKSAPAANDTGPAPPALAGRRSELRAGRAPSMLERGWEAARQAIFGSEDREEAKAAGVGLQPTPAEMAEAAWMGSAMLGGPLSIGANLPRIARAAPLVKAVRGNPVATMAAYGAVPGAAHGSPAEAIGGAVGGALVGAPAVGNVAGKVRHWAAAHPAAAGAIADAAPELLQGDVQGAAMEAVRGAIGGAVLGAGGRRLARRSGAGPAAPPDLPSDPSEALRQARALAAAGRNEEAQALVEAARRNPATKPPRAFPTAAPAPERAVAPSSPAKAPAPAPAAVDRGKAAATSHNEMMAFAKKIASDDPKVGERIHLLLDSNGKPVRRLTQDEAGAVTKRANRAKKEGRAPEETTVWVKNLWTKPGRI
jgi:hypothetical protein